MWVIFVIFNAQGRVPTNRTTQTSLVNKEENRWQCAESIALLAAIAGLFHDFGKSGRSFQQSLTQKNARSYQPYRHEWISLRLFQAFVGDRPDDVWLAKLGELTADDESAILERLLKDTPQFSDSPFTSLQPLAKTVGWLILSHHRIPENLSPQPEQSCKGVKVGWKGNLMLTGMPSTTAEMTGHNRILRTSGSFHQERRFKARAGEKKRVR
ncbi:putative CRISPR-associated helicase [Escherichia coli]|nr:putative CRISPR-associated helicase [Escherichia coli]